jgi:hypothetical protein
MPYDLTRAANDLLAAMARAQAAATPTTDAAVLAAYHAARLAADPGYKERT